MLSPLFVPACRPPTPASMNCRRCQCPGNGFRHCLGWLSPPWSASGLARCNLPRPGCSGDQGASPALTLSGSSAVHCGGCAVNWRIEASPERVQPLAPGAGAHRVAASIPAAAAQFAAQSGIPAAPAEWLAFITLRSMPAGCSPASGLGCAARARLLSYRRPA